MAQTGIGGLLVLCFETEEQRARWVEPILSGEVITSYALSQAGIEPDPERIATGWERRLIAPSTWASPTLRGNCCRRTSCGQPCPTGA